ncbi:GNAT family N-acetyltransferase [Loktanella sp. DJP18]|uniref:GNAT family N-acetyltransferase n=1 Tax=Loktanella sp. DJP18 TaxID=3409788 RepID=UPI003BB725B8
MFHSSIEVGSADIPVRIVLETTVERCPEGALMFYKQIRAFAQADNDRRCEVGVISAWHAVYPDLNDVIADASHPATRQLLEFDDISFDAGRTLEDVLSTRASFTAPIKRSLSGQDIRALCYLERLAIHPALRGRGLGLAMLREMRAHAAGVGTLVMLKAIPIDTPYDQVSGDDFERGAMQTDREGSRALQSYYKSDAQLGFVRPSRSSKCGVLAAIWDPFSLSIAQPFALSVCVSASLFD